MFFNMMKSSIDTAHNGVILIKLAIPASAKEIKPNSLPKQRIKIRRSEPSITLLPWWPRSNKNTSTDAIAPVPIAASSSTISVASDVDATKKTMPPLQLFLDEVVMKSKQLKPTKKEIKKSPCNSFTVPFVQLKKPPVCAINPAPIQVPSTFDIIAAEMKSRRSN